MSKSAQIYTVASFGIMLPALAPRELNCAFDLSDKKYKGIDKDGVVHILGGNVDFCPELIPNYYQDNIEFYDVTYQPATGTTGEVQTILGKFAINEDYFQRANAIYQKGGVFANLGLGVKDIGENSLRILFDNENIFETKFKITEDKFYEFEITYSINTEGIYEIIPVMFMCNDLIFPTLATPYEVTGAIVGDGEPIQISSTMEVYVIPEPTQKITIEYGTPPFYDISDGNMLIDITVVNNGDEAIRLGEVQAGELRFLDADVVENESPYPAQYIKANGLTNTDNSPIQPGDSRTTQITLKEIWVNASWFSSDSTKNLFIQSFFYDENGVRRQNKNILKVVMQP